jgi:predicted DNA-binding ribbon-helix-helix protein
MENIKNIFTEVTYDTWKKLKIISIQEDLTLKDLIANVLTGYAKRKKIESAKSEEVIE